jgi:branched-chain amino acid transport system ATP-binding protein
MSISDEITVLHQGSVIAEGPPEEIQNNPLVREAYLGSE